MSEAIRTVGVAVIAGFCALLLREAGFHGAKLASSVALIGIMGLALSLTAKLFLSLGIDKLDGDAEWAVKMFIKLIGVGYVFGVGSDVCREMGEGGIASALLTVGRVEVLLICLPAFREILELGISYLK